MKFETKKIILLLLLVTFLKGLVWAIMVPIWHTPDEQAHFAEIEFIAEKRRLPTQILNQKYVEKDLSKEILISEQLLGTERNGQGNNKFTYHFDYNIPYTDETIGMYEKQIANISVSQRQEMVKNEATNYPPLYYLYSVVAYWLAYGNDLFTRVFMVRLFSVILLVLMVYFAFRISEEIFADNSLMQLAVPILVSFQPMLTFVSSGVNSDSLINLLFTIFIYLGLLIFKKGLSFRLSILMGMIIGFGVLTKPQFFIPLPIILCLFMWEARKKQWLFIVKKIFIFSFVFLVSGGWWVIRSYFLTGNPTTVNLQSYVNSYSSLSIFEYTKIAFIRTVRETLPWYWGVFKWLGLTLPRLANQIMMRLLVLAFVGFIVWIIRIVRSKKIKDEAKNLTFLFLVNAVYVGSLYLFDFYFMRTHGFSIGMQGRYFFPAISIQMIFLLLGIINLFPVKWLKVRNFSIICLCMGFIALNLVALATVFNSYYPSKNLSEAINWVSQYKPWFTKVNNFLFILFLYIGSLFLLIKELIKKYVHIYKNDRITAGKSRTNQLA